MSTVVALGMTNITVWAQDKPTQDNTSTVELKTVDCRRLLKLNDSEKEAAIIFFHGYISGKNSDLTADVPALSEVTDKVIDHCIDNPNDALLTVFEQYRGR